MISQMTGWDDPLKTKLSLDADFRNLEIGRLLRCSDQMDAFPIAKFHDPVSKFSRRLGDKRVTREPRKES